MPLTKASRAWMVRACFWVFGSAALLLGIIGVFLPLLPTTPFILLSAACFARASPRVEAWLLNHKTFGPVIADWRDRRAIPVKGKVAACLGMSISFGLFLAFSHPAPWLIALVFISLTSIAAYVVSRPH